MARAGALAAALAAALLVAVPRRGRLGRAGAAARRHAVHGPSGVTVEACLNPFACRIQENDPFLHQVLEGAFETGPDPVQRPNLISGYTIVRKPFTVTYRIRPRRGWSDGRPVTAADFQFTHKQPPPAPHDGSTSGSSIGRSGAPVCSAPRRSASSSGTRTPTGVISTRSCCPGMCSRGTT